MPRHCAKWFLWVISLIIQNKPRSQICYTSLTDRPTYNLGRLSNLPKGTHLGSTTIRLPGSIVYAFNSALPLFQQDRHWWYLQPHFFPQFPVLLPFWLPSNPRRCALSCLQTFILIGSFSFSSFFLAHAHSSLGTTQANITPPEKASPEPSERAESPDEPL